MSESALIFEQITVRRALGISPEQQFELGDLQPGINLLHGPNGSGKTTAARVAQTLIWPEACELGRPWISGRLRLDGSRWQVDIEAGRARWQRDGEDCDGPPLGPPTARPRYYLSLHELLRGDQDDVAFAREVAKVVQGGLDLQAAADRLGFRDKPKVRTTERKHLARLRKQVDEAQRRQREVQKLGRERSRLEREKRNAAAAAGNIHLLTTALEYHKHLDACREIERQLDALPDAVAELRGDEDQQLRDLDDRLRDLEDQRARLTQSIEEHEQQRSDAALPEGGLPPETVTRLHGRCRDLGGLESRTADLRDRLADCREQADKARRRLADVLTDEQLDRLDRVEQPELTALCRRAQQLEAQRSGVEARRRALASDDEVPAASPDTFRDGLQALTDWLASAPPQAEARRRWRSPGLAGGLVLAVLAIVLAVALHWAWLGLLAVAAGLGAWEGLGRRGRSADHRPVHRQRYEKLDLPRPAAWQADEVARLMDELSKQLAAARLEQRRATLREEVEAEADRLAEQEERVQAELANVREQLGVPRDIADDAWLANLAETICRWQEARDGAAGIAAALEQADGQQAELLQELNIALAEFGYEPTRTANTLAGLIDRLDQRRQTRDAADRAIRDAGADLRERVEPTLRRTRDERAKLFERLGLAADDEATLRDWLKLKPRHDELVQALGRVRPLRDEKQEKLADHPHLLETPAEQLERDLNENRDLADQLESLTEEIRDIDHQVRQAKEGHELTDALAERDDVVEWFRQVRESDCRDVVGSLLRDYVQQQGASRSQPEVLRRANGYLQRFTHHRLTLELDSRSDPPAFVARDNVREERRPLEQLSTGERVQLLMAVRMGFIEHEEQAKLPLILDEALGVSDDERAVAIMDAVIEIARQGRQVFYLTAQHDELAKWQSRMAEKGLDCEPIDLMQARGETGRPARPLAPTPLELDPVPAPDGLSRDAYGRELGVPELDPWAESLDDLHLWHLIEDPGPLHKLLNYRIETWGQLKALVEHGGEGLTADTRQLYRQADAAARAVEAARHGWRIGRGKRLDRLALTDADCVSEKFAGPVGDLCEACHGDAETLLDRVADEIDGWGPARTKKLRDFLEREDYLDRRAPLSSGELHARVLAAVGDDVRAGRLSRPWLDRLLAVFGAGPA